MNWTTALEMASTIDTHYAMSDEDVEFLFYAIKNNELDPKSVIVELGMCHGRTSAVLAYIARETDSVYYGVDDFSLEGNAKEVRASLNNLMLPYTILEGRTQDVPWYLPIDVLLVDAGHDEANVKADCEKWIPFVKPGGFAAFDDWDESPRYDDRTMQEINPHWAIAYYARLATPGWEEIKCDEGRMVLRLKPE